jgi:hypothetical protein
LLLFLCPLPPISFGGGEEGEYKKRERENGEGYEKREKEERIRERES